MTKRKKRRIITMYCEGYLLWRIVRDCGCEHRDVERVIAESYGLRLIEGRLRNRTKCN